MHKVYIVGAGCGDLNLYTLKALHCIKEADCIIYDDLIDLPILDYCKDSCKKVYAGKRQHKLSIQQDDINHLILDNARKYECVVRLKGGDPYVFGRGGEEGMFLYEHHIPFEVVPGISSCVGGLAYAGIPVTHRGVSRGFQVYTGHFKNDEHSKIHFETMLNDEYTYIFLMSITKMKEIADGFMEAGKSKDTMVAVVSHASLASQQVLVSTLENVVDDYTKNPLPTPGMIVVGDVVKMHEYLDFQSLKPLFGKKVLVGLAGKDPHFIENLQFLGAEVTQLVTGEIEYLEPELSELSGYLIFTSRHGVTGFMNAFLKQYHDVRKLSDVKIIAVGKKTNEKLNEYGLCADYLPSVASGATVNEEFKDLVKGSKVYLACGTLPSSVTIHTESIVVYRNKEIELKALDDRYDYGLFTSPSAFKRYYEVNGSKCRQYIAIGNHTEKVINDIIDNAIVYVSDEASKDSMIDKVLEVEEDWTNRCKNMDVAGFMAKLERMSHGAVTACPLCHKGQVKMISYDDSGKVFGCDHCDMTIEIS